MDQSYLGRTSNGWKPSASQYKTYSVGKGLSDCLLLKFQNFLRLKDVQLIKKSLRLKMRRIVYDTLYNVPYFPVYMRTLFVLLFCFLNSGSLIHRRGLLYTMVSYAQENKVDFKSHHRQHYFPWQFLGSPSMSHSTCQTGHCWLRCSLQMMSLFLKPFVIWETWLRLLGQSKLV